MPGDDAPARGVLFDVDGTLVDTTYLHAVCWGEALRQGGHVVTMAAVHRAIGMGGAELLDHLIGDDRDRQADSGVHTAHLTLYKQYWGRLRALPGAAELVRACAGRGLRVVLASSASQEEFSALRSALGADDAIACATSSTDADAGKPAPDILHAALERSGLTPRSTVFVGDAVWDGQACGRAGIPFIRLTCGGTSAAELRDNGAVEVWREPADLLANIERSGLDAVGSR
ncbi:HAD family hydrolase [Tsukamurella soli]|uniref:HAD family hydrolase n=1 Tax=Tsukamurella soli TaxID=644556 RepID=A0ABP8J6B1_9ACTN